MLSNIQFANGLESIIIKQMLYNCLYIDSLMQFGPQGLQFVVMDCYLVLIYCCLVVMDFYLVLMDCTLVLMDCNLVLMDCTLVLMDYNLVLVEKLFI